MGLPDKPDLSEASPFCGTCGTQKKNVGAPPTGKNKGQPVYVCPKCKCPTPSSLSPKTSAKASKQGDHTPGCPNCGAEFVGETPQGVAKFCSICECYFTRNSRGKLVKCDELGTIYKIPRRKRRKTQTR